MVTKSFNIDKDVLDNLMGLYPGATFTNVMLDLIEHKINNAKVPTNANVTEQLKLLIGDYNKLKTSYRQFKDDVDDRLTIIEARLK